MKTIELDDTSYEILAGIAQRNGIPTVASYIECLPQISAERKKQMDRRILRFLEEKESTLASYPAWMKFLIAVCLMHKIEPAAFECLEGFTKPNGQAVFISRSEEKIRKTSASAKPQPLGETGFFLNVHGGQKDFADLIGLLSDQLSLSFEIRRALKRFLHSNPDMAIVAF